ncbi:MAG TPA: hypothetical protein VF637_18640 [Sphingomicrobium sp.]|jgi:hypothetical protein
MREFAVLPFVAVASVMAFVVLTPVLLTFGAMMWWLERCGVARIGGINAALLDDVGYDPAPRDA